MWNRQFDEERDIERMWKRQFEEESMNVGLSSGENMIYR